MRNAALAFFIFANSICALAQQQADSDFTGRYVLVRGFPEMTDARCLNPGSCNLREVRDGRFPLSGNTTLTVIEDKGATLLVTVGDVRPSSLIGEVDRTSVALLEKRPRPVTAAVSNVDYSEKIAVIEAFQEKPISQERRATYIEKISERAKRMVRLALESGKVSDPEVASYLRQIARDITSKRIPIQNPNPYTDHWCLPPEPPTEAYALNGVIRICRQGYELESPSTMIHEMTHLIQKIRKVPDNDSLAYECTADLVAIIAMHAAKLVDDSIPKRWTEVGGYFPRCDRKFHRRFENFAVAAGIDLSKAEDL